MKITDIITEAANSAQQAAKAIAMKKAGKKPRSVDEDLTRRGFLRGLGAAAVAGAAGSALAGTDDLDFPNKVQKMHSDMMEKNPRYAKEHEALGIALARGFVGAAAENNKRWYQKTAELLQKYGVKVNEGVAEGFPHDVDHMPGPVIRNADMTTDNVKTKDKAEWDRATDSINARVFDDMSEFRTDSKGETVVGDSAVWAKWDNATQTGWFNAKGRPLKPWPIKEQGVAEGHESDAYGNTGEKHECGSCDGTGIVSYDELAKAAEYDDVCPECGGKGWVRDKESLKKKGVAEEASPMIKPPANRFDNKQEAFDYAKEHGGKVFKSTYIDPNTGIKNIIFVVKKEQGMAEGNDDHIWGSQGRFAGDTHVNVGGDVMNMIQVGDVVKYFGQKAEVVAMSKDRKRARITRGGITQDVNTSDLIQLGQDIAEDLSEEFDLIESIVEMIAEHNGVDAEVVWEDLESLTEDELYVFAVTSDPLMEDWQKANKRDRTDGMSQKAVNAYRRENPGSKLKTAVTTKPSKLKKGGKASKRRKSYCSRSRGQMKMHSISCAKTPDKAICKARRRWNC